MPRRALFLDIETTGLSRVYHDVTVIGWSRDDRFEVTAAENWREGLDLLAAELGDSVVVSFNGAHFDLPFLRHKIPRLPEPLGHVDLRHVLARAGYSGGLKRIEAAVGLARDDRVARLNGAVAPGLWFWYQRGDLAALESLLRYNHADVENMKFLLEHAAWTLDPGAEPVEFSRSSFESWRESRSGRAVVRAFTGSTSPRLTRNDLPAAEGVTVVGIDLTGSESKPTGWAVLDGFSARTRMIGSDRDILEATVAAKPTLVSIDAPLSLPFGRTSVTDDDPAFAEAGIVRTAERVLWARGVKTYPALIRSMQQLTARGIRLATDLRKLGIPVIESFPGAMQDILGMPRKGVSLSALAQCLSEYGLTGLSDGQSRTHDEIDALSSAIVGQAFWEGKYEGVGDDREGYLIVPTTDSVRPRASVVTIAGHFAAGKSTLAELLEVRGFRRVRYSEVIAELLGTSDRLALRVEGERLHASGRQTWLSHEVLARVREADRVVVDGVRYPEDSAFWTEQAGPAHFKVFVEADAAVRRSRYSERADTAERFDEVDNSISEREVDALRGLASIVFDNTGPMNAVEAFADKLAKERP